MTNEEVVKILEQEKNYTSLIEAYGNGNTEWATAYDTAIKTLKQQPCEDAVNRQAVHDLIAELLSDYLHDEDREKIEELDVKIEDLEPVTPKEKTRWIPVSERLPEERKTITGPDVFVDPSEYVLVQMKSGYMKVSRYWGSRERYRNRPWIDLDYPTTDEVIAWMSLPERYRDGDTE